VTTASTSAAQSAAFGPKKYTQQQKVQKMSEIYKVQKKRSSNNNNSNKRLMRTLAIAIVIVAGQQFFNGFMDPPSVSLFYFPCPFPTPLSFTYFFHIFVISMSVGWLPESRLPDFIPSYLGFIGFVLNIRSKSQRSFQKNKKYPRLAILLVNFTLILKSNSFSISKIYIHIDRNINSSHLVRSMKMRILG